MKLVFSGMVETYKNFSKAPHDNTVMGLLRVTVSVLRKYCGTAIISRDDAVAKARQLAFLQLLQLAAHSGVPASLAISVDMVVY